MVGGCQRRRSRQDGISHMDLCWRIKPIESVGLAAMPPAPTNG